jgi:hypothetical protein
MTPTIIYLNPTLLFDALFELCYSVKKVFVVEILGVPFGYLVVLEQQPKFHF